MNNYSTIANKEVGVATHLIHNLNSTDLVKVGNTLNTLKGYSECVEHRTPSLIPSQSKKRFVANNGRCTLVTPIDKNTSGQPQPFIVLQLNSNWRHI